MRLTGLLLALALIVAAVFESGSLFFAVAVVAVVALGVRFWMRRVTAGLRACGLRAYDSGGNFVAVAAPDGARALADAILEHGVVVRVMGERLVRITVGRREENDGVLAAIRRARAPRPAARSPR